MKSLFAAFFAFALLTLPMASADMAAESKPVARATLLHFWATWCGPCVQELPSLDRYAAELKKQGIMVMAMSEDSGGKQAVDEYLAEHHALNNLTILYDPNQAGGKQQGVSAIPTTIVIGKDGTELDRMTGSQNWDDEATRARLQGIIAGQK